MKDHYIDIFGSIQKLLIIVAHPDDMEMVIGGTVARLRKDKKSVRLLVCTDGSFGKRKDGVSAEQLTTIRKKEQVKAAQILGIDEKEIFRLPNKDCSLVDTDESLIERIVFHMRSFRPDIIMTHYFETVIENIEPGFVWINHRDHRTIGIATMNAIMPMSRDSNFFPEHKEAGLSSIEVNKILIPDLVKGKVFIDINDYIDIKRRALKAHVSQMEDSYAGEIIAEYNINAKQKDLFPYYVEKFRYYELGDRINKKEYEE